MVESPGPSLPAATVSATSGCLASTESTSRSMRASPSRSLPTPKLRLITSGIRRAAAKRMAWSIAATMAPLVETLPFARLEILRPSSWAPGATPSNPLTP